MQRFLFSITALALVFLGSTSLAQDNRVLELDANESYVELPANLLDGVTKELTIEGWIRWQRLGEWARFFDFGPEPLSLAVSQNYNTANLHAVIHHPLGVQLLRVPDALRTNHWYHIAYTISEAGSQLYVNGVLAANERFIPRFDQFRAGPHRLGRSYDRANQEGHRQIDEFRVWSVARTEQQIREAMWEKLTGREAGLIGCWNFDNSDARDLTPGQHHGVLRGNPHFSTEPPPLPSDLLAPAQVEGSIRDKDGRLQGFSNVALKKTGADSFQNLKIAGLSEFQFTVFNPEDGTFALTATLGDRSITREGLRLQAGQKLQLNLSLADPGSISGTVRMFDQTPHVAVAVQTLDSSNHIVATVLSDQAGRYRFEDLAPGQYQLRCQVLGGFQYYVAPDESQFVAADQSPKSDVQSPRSEISNHKSELISQKSFVTVQPGSVREKLDFRFAPFKKGTWRTFTTDNGLPHNVVYSLSRGGRMEVC